MAKIHGVAGEWARVRGTVYGLWPLFIGMFIAGGALTLCFFLPIWGISLLVLASMYSVWTLLIGMRRVESFFKGARGEEKVCNILSELPDSYHIFNDYLAGKSHIDHVLVGPAGIFAVETKFWRDHVTIEDNLLLVGGHLPSHSPIDQVLKEARAVKEDLAAKGWERQVTPVLAFASDTFSAPIAEFNGVVIVNSNHLRNSFNTDRVVFTPLELDRLVRIMETSR